MRGIYRRVVSGTGCLEVVDCSPDLIKMHRSDFGCIGDGVGPGHVGLSSNRRYTSGNNFLTLKHS